MNFELFIAKKIVKGKENSFSRPIIRISIVAITLGIAMMTLSLAIVQGFQTEIKKKVIGFGSHIQITKFDSKNQIEALPISINKDFYPDLKNEKGIKHIQVFANKGAILKTDEDNLGVIIKGIGSDFDWSFFENYIVEGEKLNIDSTKKTNHILISESIAKKLHLKLKDEVLCYFIQQPPRYRKFVISGIYNTGLGEMDEKVVIADIGHIQKINNWEDHQVGGFEVLIDDFDKIDEMDELVYNRIGYDLVSTSIKEIRLDIFNWLELQDMNVIVIISLLILVCGIDIISALLILILERTNMIGILKALGSRNKSIRKIFIYNAGYLILSGLVYGNILGIGLSLLQLKFGFLTLPQEAYFIDVVPIELNFLNLLLLNIGTLITCLLMLIIPSNIIANIDPIKSIRFD
ncbi:MAG: ABC transporter permease [Bacteroidetes bacterium]|nr:MAG: ABC transporter permease [Bacteroidota bacterium]MBL1146018.1 ABC transporter permease [Bacteroidota bacterium]NOG58812.1 ABC transporter permease [Bacteroidota bacterium]